jgi:HPt (histidine-containing phosphotransfer) domain-containing protein
MISPSLSADGTAPGAVAALDARALTALHELDPDGRHGMVRRILQAFENTLSRAVAELADGRPAAQPADVCRVAHKFKSSAASVGALRLAAVCAEVDKRWRDSEVGPGLNADVVRLHQEAVAALQAVRAWLRSAGEPAPR